MTLKEAILSNGGSIENYTVKDIRQIKFLLTSSKIPSFAAHKQLVEKYGFRCTADRPCSHQERLTSQQWQQMIDENRQFTIENNINVDDIPLWK